MASFYNLFLTTSNWLVSRCKQESSRKICKRIILALSEDSINKKQLSLKQLVLESQTPGGTNAHVLKELKKKKFYKVQQKVLNSVFKKFKT